MQNRRGNQKKQKLIQRKQTKPKPKPFSPASPRLDDAHPTILLALSHKFCCLYGPAVGCIYYFGFAAADT